jgi:hypothetical protein
MLNLKTTIPPQDLIPTSKRRPRSIYKGTSEESSPEYMLKKTNVRNPEIGALFL